MFRPLSPEPSTWKSFSEQKPHVMDTTLSISEATAQVEVQPTAVELLEKHYPTIYNGYKTIMEEQFELFAKKHLDYGMSNISAGTQLASQDEIDFALTGLWYRVSDKISRWKNLIITRRASQNEPLTDTYRDIANYGIIAQLVERGWWKK